MDFEYRLQIRERYKKWIPRSNPYSYVDINALSRAERLFWHDIRKVGLPFYPEFPVGNYFIDFADPIKKVGIEVDGKEFHQDRLKDLDRQQELENLGWKIFRISGVYVYEQNEYVVEEISDNENLTLEDFCYTGSEQLLRQIKKEYYS